MKKYFYATFITLLYIPIVTIGAELLPPFKNFLKATFWHHWLGKSIVLMVMYVVLVLVFSRLRNETAFREERELSWTLGLAAIGALSILLFFTYEFAVHV